MDLPDNIKTVELYYSKNQILYNLLWSGNMHFGFWDENIINHKEALDNTNAFVASCLDLSPEETVLDAGCGVGKSAFYMAITYGVKVNGITISEVQVQQALKSLEKNKDVKLLLKFENKNYTDTGYENESFDKIYAIESSCYANSKNDFAKEMYRLLKPKGKLVVSDFFLSDVISKRKQTVLNKTLYGWAVPHLLRKEKFYEILSGAGFRNIQVHDKTDVIKKSSRLAWKFGIIFYPFSWMGDALKIIPDNMHPHCMACIHQKYLFDNKVMNYNVFVSEK